MTTTLLNFRRHLQQEEKSPATITQYTTSIQDFLQYIRNNPITKETTIQYKEHLTAQYSPASVNAKLVALNCYLRFIGKPDCCVRLLKIQRQIFCREEKELTRSEYQRLLRASHNTRISLIMQTICGTGIRVSELQSITVEAIQQGKAVVNCKNKTRTIFIPSAIQKLLKGYIKKSGLTTGPIFITRNGKPVNRSNIWREMKALCKKANIPPQKVFPHNLRHLFARTFYSIEKDIVRLADLLGHSSINTTRIYTIESGEKHKSRLERVQRILAATT